MKKTLLIFSVLALLIANAHAVDISGELSGTLAGNTVYNVIGNISAGSSLTIEAGATMIFNSGVSFTVGGILQAIGNETDSILFINSPNYTWGGIYFAGIGSTASVMEYCRISGGNDYNGGGIAIYNSSPTLSNCVISGNNGINGGGGIYGEYSSIILTNCTISGNTNGGVWFYMQSTPTFINCIVSGNTGNGIWCYGAFPILTNCTVNGNQVQGVHCQWSEPTINLQRYL